MKKKNKTVLKTAFTAWRKDNVPRIGAALAYYAIFSLAPLVLILVGVSRLFFAQEAARNQLLFQLEKILSPAGTQITQTILNNAAELTAKSGTAATIIGAIIVLIGATAVFRQIHGAIDTIWHTSITKRHGHLKTFLIKNLVALLMVLGAGLLLIASFIVTAVITIVANNPFVTFSPAFLEIINTLISFTTIVIVFSVTIKMLSAVHLKWQHILPGALVTSFFFILGKFLFGLYLGLTNLGSAYGAAGAFIVFLFWVYYSAQIFLFGVELVKARSQS